MPLIQTSIAALAYIDAAPTAEALSAANALIQAEVDAEHTTTIHPSMPTQRDIQYSELVEAEHARIASGKPKSGGLDLSRYELLDAPLKGDLAAWKSALQQAYTSAEYLRGREMNLGLLETYGKNAWLIGNSRLEDELRVLEKELEAAKLDLEEVEQARRATQGNVAGEIHGLEESWKTGVGKMIETQAAAERLRQEILERKRQGAS